ncbi:MULTISPECIES: hypothetical protein [Rhodobacterales]|jgi:gas vesicle protein|uniref:hypothetical protein n=1 Tax=Rhodobacterales TaxID=204455 RepID=UPI00119BC307|nr:MULTISPECIES: hypothetical protein [Rhodobacterales]WJY21391.1 hypothetical protein QTA57_16795 [Fontisubflavum oceani]
MLNFIGLAVGAALGFWTARRRGGNRLDMLHYAAIYGLIGFIIGAFAMLVIPAPA